MNGKLTDADLIVLVTVLLNKLNHPYTTTAHSEIEILIDHLDRAPDVDPTEDAVVLLVRQKLSRGQRQVESSAG
jgi:hypothetical protein